MAGEAGPEPRTLGECRERAESVELVASLYAAGAARVWVILTPACDDPNAGKLLVELPWAQRARRRVLRLCDDLGAERGFEPDPDDDRRYALLMLD